MPDISGAVALGNGIPILGQPAPASPIDQIPPTVVTEFRFGPMLVNHPVEGPQAALLLQFGLPDGQKLPPLILVADEDGLLQLPDLLRKAIREARHGAGEARTESEAKDDEQ